jgi:uncharacterized protein (DUF302 family)
MNRFEAEVRARGMIAFAHIDHAAGAAAVGLSLRPTELLIFGNARGGTPLMELVQMTGIDLPLKALVWQDASGVTWLSYNDPTWIAKRHGLASDVGPAVSVLTAALNQMARSATKSRGWSDMSAEYRLHQSGHADAFVQPVTEISWVLGVKVSCDDETRVKLALLTPARA